MTEATDPGSMLYKRYPARERFDPNRAFAARKALRLRGKDYVQNDPVNKDEIDPRRLRQMYDQRMVFMLPVDAAPPPPKRPKFRALPEDALRAWLRAHGTVPRASWTRETLEAKAAAAWDKQDNAPAPAAVVSPPVSPPAGAARQRVRTTARTSQ